MKLSFILQYDPVYYSKVLVKNLQFYVPFLYSPYHIVIYNLYSFTISNIIKHLIDKVEPCHKIRLCPIETPSDILLKEEFIMYIIAGLKREIFFLMNRIMQCFFIY